MKEIVQFSLHLHAARPSPTAFSMNCATLRGWATKAAWEPLIVSVVAFILSAMNFSASGDTPLSFSEMRYQDGIVFQPAAVAGSCRAAPATGRWVTAITSATSVGASAQNVS